MKTIIDFYFYMAYKHDVQIIVSREIIEEDDNKYLSFDYNNNDIIYQPSSLTRHFNNIRFRDITIYTSTMDFYTDLVLYFENHILEDVSTSQQYFL